MFRKDFAAQCGKWRKEGDRLIVIMDANEHTMDGKRRKMLEAEGIGLVEFSHKYRVVVAYNICNGKPEGLRTQYQQLKRYCQNKNINTGPKELFRKDFAAQCGKWRKEGDRLIVIMDAKEHTMDGKLRKC